MHVNLTTKGTEGTIAVKTGSLTKQMLASEVQGSFKWGQFKKWAEKKEREWGKKLKWAYDNATRCKRQKPGKEKYLARRSEDQDNKVTWEN